MDRVLQVLGWWVSDFAANPRVVAKIQELIRVIKEEMAAGSPDGN